MVIHQRVGDRRAPVKWLTKLTVIAIAMQCMATSDGVPASSPALNGHSAHVLTVAGSLPDTLHIRLLVDYTTLGPAVGHPELEHCQTHPQEGSSRPLTLTEPLDISSVAGQFHASILVDKYLPGPCGWHFDAIGFTVLKIAAMAAMFERAESIPPLLRNLRIAYQKSLLLAPEFYDEGNLLRFFGSARVTSVGHEQALPHGVTDIVIGLTGGNMVLNQMNVSLRLGCSPVPEYGSVKAHTSRAGRATLMVAALPGLTVRAVRGVFGKESKFLPEGDGPDFVPTGLGLLIYETPANYRDGRATKAGSEITFKITLSLAGRGPDYANEPLFTDNDRVDSVEMFQSER